MINRGSKDINAYFIYRNNGYLVNVPDSPFPIGNTPTNVIVHPSGKYVFVTAKNNYLYAFHVQRNGSLALVPGSPFSTVNEPRGLGIDPQGKYLYVSSLPTSSPASGQVDAYIINSTDGALTPVSGSPYAVPTNSGGCENGAWDISVHPSGNYLVVPSECEGLVVYRISRTTGSLSLINGSPFPVSFPPNTEVESVAMDPLGQYLWISSLGCSSGCDPEISTWKFNTATGVPTWLERNPNNGCGLLVRPDPSGKFIYESGDGFPGCGTSGGMLSPAILGYSVDRNSGVLTDIPGSPFLSPNSESYLSDGLVITP